MSEFSKTKLSLILALKTLERFLTSSKRPKNILFLLAEIAVRDKGFFISNDLKEETNLSDKSVERFINFLVKKKFYLAKVGNDKRRKLYYPSKNLHKHIMSTWSVRVQQNEAVVDFGPQNVREILDFFKTAKEYPFPDNKKTF